ncbi:MAG: UvrABC system protein A [Candidatus Dojkabacteria bacterium]|nr:MAG: UvrABC system protein A [Candidatus Dojkabacteria bacterium]
MADQFIKVKGARVHNLKNIDVSIPKNKLVVITGLSGSGKSSLAFDTIYAEGQRRYVESLSSYARQFLGMMEKPDVDYIEGLSPAIAIDQKSTSSNPRSTVGTITEIYDYLRLLFARVGKPFCYKCGRPIESQTVQEIVDSIFELPKKHNKTSLRILLLAPIVKDRKGSYEDLFINLLNKGFARVRVDGEIKNLEDDITLKKTTKHKIEIVVDRLSIPANISPELLNDKDSNSIDYKSIGFENEQEFLAFKQRVTDSVETCLRYGEGELIINLYDEAKDILFSENLVCKHDKISYPQIEPHTFSFNSPHGACPHCSGLGYIKTIDPQLIYNPNLTIAEGAIFPWSRSVDPNSWYMRQLDALAKKLNFSLKTKMKDLPKNILDEILYGSKTTITLELEGNRFTGQFETKFEGVIPNLERRYRETDSEHIRSEIEKYMVTKTCPVCDGTRLRPEALSIRVCGKNIVEVTKMNIEQGLQWIDSLTHIKPELYPANTTFQKNGILYRKLVIYDEEYEEELTLSEPKYEIAKTILKEISTRLKFLMDVGLGYLTLDRNASTLSGGEAQRIRLASQIGSGLSGVLYVLDEPSIGLHQRDNSRLINTLKHLRDIGNTVIVVEHSEETMNEADWIIDMGEGAGINGGNIVAQGTPEEIKKDQFSVTGPFLNKSKIVGSKYLDSKAKKRILSGKKIVIKGARQNNLKNIDIEFPLGKLICVTGVSGSGKSTLVNSILYTALHNHFYKTRYPVGEHDNIEGIENIDKVIRIDQSPIGKTPRSNPATYTGFFDEIRNVFANTNEAKLRGYTAGRFSFNVKGGRCESCKGDGVIKIEMQFLPDVYVPCEVCKGKRYNRETLEVQYKGKNIHDVLEMTVDEAVEFFNNIPAIYKHLKLLQEVGLGYIKIGQPSTTLSGGEAQRIKLATELAKKSTGKTLYILDEPTIGLHFADTDKLLEVLHKLVEKGNTMIIIEHNLDVIKTADWIIDLGPEGGDAGGYVVATGTVQDIINSTQSWTGHYLRKVLV